MRVLIIGGPKTGKTTVAKEMAESSGLEHLCTDPQRMCPPGVKGVPDKLDWSGASAYVAAEWLGKKDTIIEGVALPRALRKWRVENPDQPPPCDHVFILNEPHLDLSTGQAAMGKGVDTVLKELYDWLEPVIAKNV